MGDESTHLVLMPVTGSGHEALRSTLVLFLLKKLDHIYMNTFINMTPMDMYGRIDNERYNINFIMVPRRNFFIN